MIATLGDLIEDVVVWAGEDFRPGTDTTSRIVRTRGGSAANVAAGITACGGAARFIGRVGDDDLGDRLVASLVAAGVEVVGERAGRTGCLVAIVSADGERSFFTDRGAAAELEHVDPGWLEGCTSLHVPAYGFDGKTVAAAVERGIGAARRLGLSVSIDCSSSSLIQRMGADRFRHRLASLAPAVVFANRDEADVLGLGAGRPAPGVDTTVVRHGARATLVVSADGTTETVPVPPIDRVLDTTGAGDAFAAGFLLASATGASPVEATREGHRVAGLVLASPGADLRGTPT